MRTGKPVNFSYSSIVSERQLSDAASSAAGLYFEEVSFMLHEGANS